MLRYRAVCIMGTRFSGKQLCFLLYVMILVKSCFTECASILSFDHYTYVEYGQVQSRRTFRKVQVSTDLEIYEINIGYLVSSYQDIISPQDMR